ncbi:MAG: FHA domain-containing protein [Synechococcus sp.]|nr:FHA domain-containing protein [Synechococcus sp.]
MDARAHLLLPQDGNRRLPLDPARPLRIGRDPACELCLPEAGGLSRRHAELRWRAPAGPWELVDLGSANGTFLEGARIAEPQPLRHGQSIRLGRRGPELLFQQPAPTPTAPAATAPPAKAATPPPVAAAAISAPTDTVTIGEERLALQRIRSVEVRSLARHPHIFSWWVLTCLGGLLLLPFPLIFWPLQVGALVGAVLLGSRKEHELVVVLRDGQARRRGFSNRVTALSHRNGIRRALGHSLTP